MSFLIYDLIFLLIFILVFGIFVYKGRKNLQRQGWLYLYRTKWGINFIERITKKYQKLLKASQWVVITSGYILMVSVVYLILRVFYIYLSSPAIVKAIKVPAIFPLVPYLPELFKIDFLPSFPFTYWIIIIAIIAIPHEFAHGIFARLYKLKIRSTGFGFLGPFLAAFVEPDEKQLEKSKKVHQLTILAAGTFANILTAILFGILMWIFFVSFFVPAGINFNTYSASVINISDSNILSNLPEGQSLLELDIEGKSYFVESSVIEEAKRRNLDLIYAYDDTPAFRAKLKGAITEINGIKVNSFDSLKGELQIYSPGDNITIKTLVQENIRDNTPNEEEYLITLSEREGKAYLGIGVSPPSTRGILGTFYSFISNIKDPFVYYESELGEFGWFIYNLLWWIVIICFSVALMNMLPVGSLDGGRFFMITIWGITGSKRAGELAFKITTWIVLLLLLASLFQWAFVVF